MSEGQVGSGSGATEPGGGIARTGPPGTDPAALLLAVERLQADVNALGRAVAASPEAVAARLDVDAATAAIGVRIGALGSALDQLRLSLLAALDRAADRLDPPSWLPDLQAVLVGLGRRFDNPAWMPDLQAALTEVAIRLDPSALVPELQAGLDRGEDAPWVPEVRAGLAELGQRIDAPRWMADLQAALTDLASTAAGYEELRQTAAEIRVALEHSPRLEEIAATVARLAGDDRVDEVARAVGQLAGGVEAGAAVADALDLLGERLAAIEAAADRSARETKAMADQVASVPERLGAIAVQVDRITPLARVGDRAGTLFDQLDQLATGVEEVLALLRAGAERAAAAEAVRDDDGANQRFEAFAAVLSDVRRRLDDVFTAVVWIGDGDSSSRGAEGEAQALEAVLAAVEQQERVLADRLDQIEHELRRVGGAIAAGPATPSATDDESTRLLGAVLERVQQQERRIAEHLDWVGDRLAEDARTGAAVTQAIENLGTRLVVIEAAAGEVAGEARALADRFAPVPDRLGAIASQVDRITPLARAGDEAGSLFARLDQMAADVGQVVALLQGAAASAEGRGEGGEDGDDDRFDAIVDVLSGVTRRQDEVGEAMASLLARTAAAAVSGEPDGEATRMLGTVLDQVQQQERTIAGHLDWVGDRLAEVAAQLAPGEAAAATVRDEGGRAEVAAVLERMSRRQDELAAALSSLAGLADRADQADQADQADKAQAATAADAVFDRMEQRERSLAARLDRIDLELRRQAEPVAAESQTEGAEAAPSRSLDEVIDAVQQQERLLGDRLDQIDLELRRVAETAAADADVPGEPDGEATRMLGALLERVQQQEQTIAGHLDWVGDRLAELAVQLAPGEAAAATARDEDGRAEVAAALDRMSRRQDELAAALSSLAELADKGRGPTATEAVFDRMEQRERSLAARLDRIDLELRRRAEPAAVAAGSTEATERLEARAAALAASVEQVTAVTSNLAGLVESMAERLDGRLSRVEATLDAATRRPAPPPPPARPSPSSEMAALRLAELRAERAQVQARLQEERLLASEAWDAEP